jgi:hypothetical protein
MSIRNAFSRKFAGDTYVKVQMKTLGEIRRYAGSRASGGLSETAASHTGSSWGFDSSPTDVTTNARLCKVLSTSFKMGRGPSFPMCESHLSKHGVEPWIGAEAFHEGARF